MHVHARCVPPPPLPRSVPSEGQQRSVLEETALHPKRVVEASVLRSHAGCFPLSLPHPKLMRPKPESIAPLSLVPHRYPISLGNDTIPSGDVCNVSVRECGRKHHDVVDDPGEVLRVVHPSPSPNGGDRVVSIARGQLDGSGGGVHAVHVKLDFPGRCPHPSDLRMRGRSMHGRSMHGRSKVAHITHACHSYTYTWTTAFSHGGIRWQCRPLPLMPHSPFESRSARHRVGSCQKAL